MRKKIISSLIILIIPLLIVLSFFCPQLSTIAVNKKNVAISQTTSIIENLPILMYHNILNTRKSKYIVSEQEFDSDLSYLKQNGYETILPRDLVAFVSGKKTLPAKPIMITFDDGRYNNYYYGKPLLEKYGYKATLNIIGKFSNNTTMSGDHSNPNYSHLTWEQIAQINKEATFEIGNHTWNMHNLKPRKGVARLPGESDAKYIENLNSDFITLQDKLKRDCNVDCSSFAYPFGNITRVCADVLESLNFNVIFWASEGTNKIVQGDFSTIKKLKRFNRDGQIDFKKLLLRMTNRH